MAVEGELWRVLDFADQHSGFYGPSFGSGDTIGCGLLSDRREIFFTKNGNLIGVAFSDVKATLYPTVGLHSPGGRAADEAGRPVPSGV